MAPAFPASARNSTPVDQSHRGVLGQRIARRYLRRHLQINTKAAPINSTALRRNTYSGSRPLTAAPFFTPAGTQATSVHFNQFGGTIGGPITIPPCHPWKEISSSSSMPSRGTSGSTGHSRRERPHGAQGAHRDFWCTLALALPPSLSALTIPLLRPPPQKASAEAR